MPPPKTKTGIPIDIAGELYKSHTPRSIFSVYTYLYNHSKYVTKPGYRISEISVHVVALTLGLGQRTVVRALAHLRRSRYVICIWRGRPKPKKPRYNHSAYELPYNFPHVIAWRISGGKSKAKKLQPSLSLNTRQNLASTALRQLEKES